MDDGKSNISQDFHLDTANTGGLQRGEFRVVLLRPVVKRANGSNMMSQRSVKSHRIVEMSQAMSASFRFFSSSLPIWYNQPGAGELC